MSIIDGQGFKNILACWTAGITVVSVNSDDDWQAITVNSFASVSMVPPLVCLNIANRLITADMLTKAFRRQYSIGQQLDIRKDSPVIFDDPLHQSALRRPPDAPCLQL